MIKLSLSIHLLELIKKVIPSISGLLDYYAVRQLINHNLVWRSFLFQIFFCRTTGLGSFSHLPLSIALFLTRGKKTECKLFTEVGI